MILKGCSLTAELLDIGLLAVESEGHDTGNMHVWAIDLCLD